MADKEIIEWSDFVKESNRHLLFQMMMEHRRGGCKECAEKNCLHKLFYMGL